MSPFTVKLHWYIGSETKWPPFTRHFQMLFSSGNVWILPNISRKIVGRIRISNIQALLQIIACRLPGDKPLSEPMGITLVTYICVVRPQWVNTYVIAFWFVPRWRCAITKTMVLAPWKKWPMHALRILLWKLIPIAMLKGTHDIYL